MNTLDSFDFDGAAAQTQTMVAGPKKRRTGNTGPKTKSPTAHEELIDYIALLDRRGYTQSQIMRKVPERFGFTISQGTVSQKLSIIRNRYKEATLISRIEGVNEQLASLRDVRREAWEAYQKSMEDSDKEVCEHELVEEEVLGGDLESSERLVKRITTREGRLPANQYLNTILQTHKAERDLLGLDEEVHQNLMAISEAEQVLRMVLDAQREVLADQPELLRRVQQRCLQLIPFLNHNNKPQPIPVEVKVIEESEPERGRTWQQTD